MTLHGRAPHRPELAGIVQRLWYVENPGSGGLEVKLPTGTAQLLINLGGDRLSCGAADRRQTVGPLALAPISSGPEVLDRSEQRRLVGVVVRPEAVGALARIPADRIGPLTALDQLWGTWSDRLRDVAEPATGGPAVLDRIEAELAGLVRSDADVAADPLVRHVITRLRRNERIGTIGDRVGLSQSAWTRRFRAAVGLTPKRYQRVLRLEQVITLARTAGADGVDWADLAVRAGYFDQAHLVGDFTELTGTSPGRWFRCGTDAAFHGPLPVR
ncbi:helix-turn-helix domain-containing protein [Microlunatus sp. GCM10028923]|uniref:helix-turn-helix domain-containing protein n=1 Tax=Microlunatus sp. GCM10028923 TaxID=3273400 RepID=UPI003613D9C4